jgi:HPt (histidine-containing phosphotransfer) domain-containing protein
MSDHLSKPITQKALLETVSRATADNAGKPAHEADAPEPSGTPTFAGNLPILDPDTFTRTAGYLSPEAVSAYLHVLVERSEAMLVRLHLPPTSLPATSEPITAVAHALAGSAGMFGFERLAETARHFEYATEAHLPEASEMAKCLIQTTNASIREMRARMTAEVKSVA